MSKHLKDDVDMVSQRVQVLERELEWHSVGVEIGAGLEGMKKRWKKRENVSRRGEREDIQFS